jgi:hypothetical protein
MRNAIEAIPDTTPGDTNQNVVRKLHGYAKGSETYPEKMQKILARGSGSTGML